MVRTELEGKIGIGRRFSSSISFGSEWVSFVGCTVVLLVDIYDRHPVDEGTTGASDILFASCIAGASTWVPCVDLRLRIAPPYQR